MTVHRAVAALALALTASPGSAAEPAADEEALRREIARLRGLEARYAHAARDILDDIDRLDREALLAERELDLARLAAERGAAELARLVARERELDAELVARRSALRRALVAAYARRSPPELLALFAAGDPQALPRSLRDLARVGRAHQDAIDSFARTRAELGAARERLAEERRAQDGRARLLAERRRQAGLSRSRKEALLRNVEVRRSQAATALSEAARALGRTVSGLATSQPPPTTGFPQSRGALPWPADGLVSARFGVQSHPRFRTLIEHPGIEIATAAGAPVRAVHAGEVAWADWFKGYGLLAILAHGDDYYTLYAHLGSLAIERGRRVEAGTLLGRSGTSPSGDGTGVYFEVRHGARPENPESWLGPRPRGR